MRIGHISDLHVRDTYKADQDVILQAFFDDITAQHVERSFELIIFSGDLTFSAKANEFSGAEEVLLNPLQRILGLDRDRIVVGRGNHDNDIALIDEYAEDGLRAKLLDLETANRLLDDPKGLARAVERRGPWDAWHSEFYKNAAGTVFNVSPLATVHKLSLDDMSVAVVMLDSAWRATGKPDDYDRAHLIIGDRQVKAALKEATDCELKIAVSHHPVDWLADFDRRYLKFALGSSFPIHCTGHVHETDLTSMTSARGSYLHSAAGSLYGGRSWINSYNVIDLDPDGEDQQVTVRSYYSDREEFDLGVNAVRGGRVHFAVPLRHKSSAVVAPNQQPKLLDHIEAVARERAVLMPANGVSTISDFLVQPVFLPLPYEQWVATQDPETWKLHDDLTSDDVLARPLPLALIGTPGSGVSSALEWLASSKVERDPTLLPVILSADRVAPGATGIEKAIRGFLAEAGATPDLHEDSKLLIFMDDLKGGSSRHWKVLARLLSYSVEHPNVGIALGATMAMRSAIEEESRKAGITPSYVYLGPFGRAQLRQLAEIADPSRSDLVLNRVTALVAKEGLTRTPFMMATLTLVVAAEEGLAQGANETGILSGYADALLGRSEVMEDPRLGMDFRGRENVLSVVAAKMVNAGKSKIERNKLEEFLIEYFGQLGWTESASRLVEWLINRRVLTELTDGQMTFLHPAFVGFFAARRFIEDEEFKALILEDVRGYPEIVRHASGLARNDKDLLMKSREVLQAEFSGGDGQVDELFADATDAAGWISWEDERAFNERIAQRFKEMDKSHRDEKGSDDGDVGESFSLTSTDRLWDYIASWPDRDAAARQVMDDAPPLFRMIGNLTSASSVLRNSELVADATLKRDMLAEVLGGWADVATVIAATPAIRDGFADAYDAAFPPPPEGEDDRAWKYQRESGLLVVPVVACLGQIEASLFSRKLKGALRGLLDDQDFVSQAGHNLMAVGLAAQLGMHNWHLDLRGLVRRHGSKRVISVAAEIICNQFLATTSDTMTEEMLDTLADVIVTRYSEPIAQKRNAMREQIKERLRMRSLLKQRSQRPLAESVSPEVRKDEMDVA